MKRPKFIFYLIYLIFHVSLLIASIYVNYKSEDFEFLLWLREKMDLMIYVSIIGLILYLIDITWANIGDRSLTKEKERMSNEINSLKAKMFDLQEASSHKTPSVETTDEVEEESTDN